MTDIMMDSDEDLLRDFGSVWPDWAILKDLGNNFSYKSSTNICALFKTYFLSKNFCGYLLVTTWKMATFDSNIWSHCFGSNLNCRRGIERLESNNKFPGWVIARSDRWTFWSVRLRLQQRKQNNYQTNKTAKNNPRALFKSNSSV